jgi:hypothetical protein
MARKPEYGNWVSKRLVYVPGLASLALLGSALFLPVLIIPAALFFVVFAYFAYARYPFSSQGRNVEDRIRELVLAHLDWIQRQQGYQTTCCDYAENPDWIRLALRFSA